MAYYIRHNPDETTIELTMDTVIGNYPYNNPYNDRSYGSARTSWRVRNPTYGTTDHKEVTHWDLNAGSVKEKPLIARRRFFDSNGDPWINVIDTFHVSRQMADPYAWYPSVATQRRMENQAARVDTEALNKLAGFRDAARASIGQALLEARTTLDMLAGVVIPPVSALIAIKKGNLALARRIMNDALFSKDRSKWSVDPRTVAGGFLQFQYGWKPLLKDIYDVNELLGAAIAKPMTFKMKHSRKLVNEYEDANTKRRETGINGIGLEVEFRPDGLSALDAAGLANPLSLAWEVVPFSFVADWFMPLGSTFQALTATANLHLIRGYRNSKIEDEFTYFNNGDGYSEVLQRGEYRVDRTMFNRFPIYNFPMPKIYANENPFSTSRVLSASALLTQLFTGRA